MPSGCQKKRSPPACSTRSSPTARARRASTAPVLIPSFMTMTSSLEGEVLASSRKGLAAISLAHCSGVRTMAAIFRPKRFSIPASMSASRRAAGRSLSTTRLPLAARVRGFFSPMSAAMARCSATGARTRPVFMPRNRMMRWSVMASAPLAGGAPEGRAAGLDGAFDHARAAVAGARFALAAVDVEAVLEIALAALGVGEVAQGRAAGGDGVVEHVADFGGEGLQPGLRDLAGGDERRDACAEQGLADVDVAEPGDDALVQQADLDVLLLAGEGLGQAGAGEGVAERLGTQAGEPRMGLDRVGRDQAHEAEAAGVGEAEAGRGAVAHGAEAEVLVLAGGGGGLLELAQLFAVEGEAAGHAEVGHPGLAGGQRHEQVFGAAVDALDGRPLEPPGEAIREGEAQVGAVLAHPRQPRALEHRLQAAADGLDLGEFGHVRF